MRLRSTGLGKTELEGNVVNIKKVHDSVIFFVDTTQPVKWHTRMLFQEEDLRALILALLRPANLSFIFKALFASHKKVPRTENF
jgi:hypothetical protein